MNIRRLVLDVDKAIIRPSLLELGRAIESVKGVQGVNITVNEIDLETVGTNVTIEREEMGYQEIEKAIEDVGCVVHSIDQLVSGSKLVEQIRRER